MTRYHTGQSPKVKGPKKQDSKPKSGPRGCTHKHCRHVTTRGVYTSERTRLARSKEMMGLGESMGWVVGWVNGASSATAATSTATAPGSEAVICLLQCSCEGKTRAVSRARVGGGLEGAGAPVQRHCPGPNPSHTQSRSQVPAAEMTLRNMCVGDCVWRLHACASHACPHPTRPWHGFIDLRVYTAHYMDARACTQGYLPPAARANMGAVAELM